MTRRTSFVATAVSACTSAAVAGVSIDSVADEQFFTIFNDTGGPGAAGSIYAPTAGQNAIGGVATFSAKGRVAFMQNGPYYLANNNVAWGFAGAGRADVTFASGVETVSIAVRGTTGGDVTGPNASFPFDPGTTLIDADAAVWALDGFGNFIAGSRIGIENLSLRGDDISEINYSAPDLGQTIYGVAFVQNIDDPAAGIMVGGLGFTIPTPGGLGLLGLAGALAIRRRR